MERDDAANLRFLAEASAVLSSSLDVGVTLTAVAELAVPSIADWCAVEMLDDGGGLQQLAVAHRDPEKRELGRAIRRQFPPDARRATVAVLRSGKSALYARIDDAVLRQAAQNDEHFEQLRQIGLTSAMVVPMVARGRAHGAITFASSESGRVYDQHDLEVAEQLAERAAMAIDNAALFEAEQRAREAAEHASERLTRIQHVTAEMATALTAERIAEITIDNGVEAAGALTGALWIKDQGDQQLRMLRSRGFPEVAVERFKLVPLGGPSPLADCVRRAEPVFLESPDQYTERYSVSAGRTRPMFASEVLAIACLPLIAGERVLGGISLAFEGERRFSPDERRFLVVLADHCALSLERARLYQEAQDARAIAEAALQSREQVIAVVAHDLRNLLQATEMRASMLLRRARSDRELACDAEAIQRSTEGMSRLIDDLLDAAAIEAGRLSIDLAPCEIGPLCQAALESAELLASDRGIEVVSEVGASDLVLSCDRARLLQVLANVIGNAIKFSPRGGRVKLACSQRDGELCFAVRDHGPGIPPDLLERVFERYFRADDARPGVGLGLYISRALVEAHGGRIWIESRPGQTDVFVALPLTYSR